MQVRTACRSARTAWVGGWAGSMANSVVAISSLFTGGHAAIIHVIVNVAWGVISAGQECVLPQQLDWPGTMIFASLPMLPMLSAIVTCGLAAYKEHGSSWKSLEEQN